MKKTKRDPKSAEKKYDKDKYKDKDKKEKLAFHQELLDAAINELLSQVCETVDEIDGPRYFIEWQASFYRWLAMVQSRIADLSLGYIETHIQDEHVAAEDGTYWQDSEELKDAKKLQGHIKK